MANGISEIKNVLDAENDAMLMKWTGRGGGSI